jgi:hypothetical protein
MDGWTTLAALRDRGLSSAPVAIVSANAFDKLLLGEAATAHVAPGGGEIGPGDFFVKPVRVTELLAWLDRHVPEARRVPAAAAPPAAPGAAAPGADLADLADLAGLRRALALGHLRGVLAGLDRIDRLERLDPPGEPPPPPAWTEEARRLARAFQFEAVARLVDSRFGAPASALSGQDDEAARPAGPQDLV